MKLRIGSRESALAKWQAHFIADRLHSIGCDVEFVWLTTEGDRSARSSEPLTQAAGVGVFTKAIQRALLENQCDVAVHSLKDLPTAPVEGLTVVATTEREDPRDCFLSERFACFDELPRGAKIGTGSPRRVAQLLKLRPDIQCVSIRGNVDTRIQKMKAGEYDAILLAAAGLRRLKLDAHIKEYFDIDRLLPAVGQAALGIECRSDDQATIDVLHKLNHWPSWLCVVAERTVLRELQAGCLAPMGVHATLQEQQLTLRARLLSQDGSSCLQTEVATQISNDRDVAGAEELGLTAAKQLRSAGADRLLA